MGQGDEVFSGDEKVTFGKPTVIAYTFEEIVLTLFGREGASYLYALNRSYGYVRKTLPDTHKSPRKKVKSMSVAWIGRACGLCRTRFALKSDRTNKKKKREKSYGTTTTSFNFYS